jgi:hypothetical protein
MKRSRIWLAALGIVAAGLFWAGGTLIVGRAPQEQVVTGTSGVFSPAHVSMEEAVRHFLGLRDAPVQPIRFPHQLHVQEVGLRCDFCHDGVSVSPNAGLPGVDLCMLCHSEVARDYPEVQRLVEFYESGLEPPWERVYGWHEESHVHFNHRPHFLAGIGCENCHGDVGQMTVAERVVDHTMGFCVTCHEQSGASNECVACHY